MKKYSWIFHNWEAKVPIDTAVTELERIESVYGAITAENILKEATKLDNPLHGLFEWNEEEAAKQWRLQQARVIVNNIQITIVSDGEPRQVGAFEITKSDDGRQYKSVEVLDKNDVSQIREEAKAQLRSLKKKLEFYDHFGITLKYLKEAEKSLE